MLGLDVIGARTKQTLVGDSSAITTWDKTQAYAAGAVVRYYGQWYKVTRAVDSASLLWGNDAPDKTDAWRNMSGDEVSQYLSTPPPVLGADVDVDALVDRFDSLEPTNRIVWSLWVDNGHGAGLDERVSGDAQKLLNQAIIPTTELSFHDAVMTFHKRFMALDSRVTAQPMDDNPSPVWSDVKNYIVDGSRLANLLEGTANQTMKWSDVKAAVHEAAQGAGNALGKAASTVKWTTYGIVGGAVLLGVGALYTIYKIASSPAGGAIVGGYLGGRR